MSVTKQMVGRYAPSPTGDLHLGNLRTALLAWLHVRLNQGRFLMRMEDLDTPRVVAGSADKILFDLEWMGLDWDGEVVYQSQRTSLYQDALNALKSRGLTYPCFCSRKDIQLAASAPHAVSGVYPGTCADLNSRQVDEMKQRKQPAIRVRVNEELKHDCGDFVILRADGLFAYQLAVVVDDLEQGVTDVVRGVDLQSSTPRQIYLANLLTKHGGNIRYHHVPLLLDDQGNRMSKRDGSFSAAQWREQNRSAESLIAHLAKSLGLVATEQSISATDLLDLVSESDLEAVFEDA